MIYNDEHNVIFIHLIKTGGESVTHALKGDSRHKRHIPVRFIFEDDWSRFDKKQFPILHRECNKIAAGEIKQRWYSHLRVTTVRNPWARAVSEYEYNIKKGIEARSFEDAIYNRSTDVWKKSQTWWLLYNNKIQADRIMKLESIHEDFERIFPGLELPHKNKSNPGKHYTEYYDDNTRKIIHDLYYDDVTEFDYKFD